MMPCKIKAPDSVTLRRLPKPGIEAKPRPEISEQTAWAIWAVLLVAVLWLLRHVFPSDHDTRR